MNDEFWHTAEEGGVPGKQQQRLEKFHRLHESTGGNVPHSVTTRMLGPQDACLTSEFHPSLTPFTT
jgi:hypothetical protein